MMIFRDYVVVTNNDLTSFKVEIDNWSRKGYVLFIPIKFIPEGKPYRYLAVMERTKAEEEK